MKYSMGQCPNGSIGTAGAKPAVALVDEVIDLDSWPPRSNSRLSSTTLKRAKLPGPEQRGHPCSNIYERPNASDWRP
jgi:hypothetical protein